MNPWKTKRYFKYMYKMLHLNVKPPKFLVDYRLVIKIKNKLN